MKAILTATASTPTTRANTAYSINLRTEIPAVTTYDDYPFDAIIELGGVRYGVASDGLYTLDGTGEVSWSFETAYDSMGTTLNKNVEALYLTGTLDGTLTAGVNGAYLYESTVMTGAGPKTYRIVLSKGLKECYYSFSLSGSAVFSLDALEYHAKTMGRRLW